jgi:hypothetical protein
MTSLFHLSAVDCLFEEAETRRAPSAAASAGLRDYVGMRTQRDKQAKSGLLAIAALFLCSNCPWPAALRREHLSLSLPYLSTLERGEMGSIHFSPRPGWRLETGDWRLETGRLTGGRLHQGLSIVRRSRGHASSVCTSKVC